MVYNFPFQLPQNLTRHPFKLWRWILSFTLPVSDVIVTAGSVGEYVPARRAIVIWGGMSFSQMLADGLQVTKFLVETEDIVDRISAVEWAG